MGHAVTSNIFQVSFEGSCLTLLLTWNSANTPFENALKASAAQNDHYDCYCESEELETKVAFALQFSQTILALKKGGGGAGGGVTKFM